MKAHYRAAGIGVLILLLVTIRFFESHLFYDPLLQFFSSDYLQDKVPHFNRLDLLLNVFYRFFLNTLISLGIIYIAFLDKSIVKFSILLFAILFLLSFTLFTFFVLTIENQNYMALFYVRRFLIHPIFVIILLPAFYYYRLNRRKSNKFKSFPQKN